MSDSLGISSPVAAAALALYNGLTWDRISIGTSALQSGLYYSTTLTGQGRLIRAIRGVAIGWTSEITDLFSMINAGFVVLYAKKFVDALEKKYSFSLLTAISYYTLGVGAPVIAIAGAYLIGKAAMRSYQVDKREEKDGVVTTTVRKGAAIEATKAILSIGRALVEWKQLPFMLAVASSCYNWVKQFGFSRMTFSKDLLTAAVFKPVRSEDGLIIRGDLYLEASDEDLPQQTTIIGGRAYIRPPIEESDWGIHLAEQPYILVEDSTELVGPLAWPSIYHADTRAIYQLSDAAVPSLLSEDDLVFPLEDNPITKVSVAYHMKVLPVQTDNTCSICLESKDKSRVWSCLNHSMHEECLANVVAAFEDRDFLSKLSFAKCEVRHFRNHMYTHLTYVYHIEVKENDLFRCALCRETPPHGAFTMTVHEGNKAFRGIVNVLKPTTRQPLFEKAYAVYSVVQAMFAGLARYPELAKGIFFLQSFLSIIDVFGYGATLYYLSEAVRKKLGIERSVQFYVVAALAVFASAILSWAIVVQINAYLQSTHLLREVLSQMGVEGIEITWAAPEYTQKLYANRIIATLALAFFSEQRKTNMVSALAQTVGLLGMSQLQWLKVAQTLEWPLYDIVANGGRLARSVGASSLKKLDIEIYFVTNAFRRWDAGYLRSMVTSISDSMSSLFHGSAWSRFWRINTYQGVEIGRRLCYYINFIRACPEAIGDISMRAIDATLGAARVEHSWLWDVRPLDRLAEGASYGP